MRRSSASTSRVAADLNGYWLSRLGDSERQGRLIDSDQPGSMEKKKQEGYF